MAADWPRIKRAAQIFARLKNRLYIRVSKMSLRVKTAAEKRTQAHLPIHSSYEVFITEIKLLRACAADWDDVNGKVKWQRNRSTKQTTSFYRFDTSIHNRGILRVNGRIKRGNISNDLM